MTDLVPAAPEAPSTLAALRVTVRALDEERAELAEAGEWERLAVAIRYLDTLTRDLRELRSACEQDVARLMMEIPSNREFVEGLGTVELHTSIRRHHWEIRDLALAAVANAVEAGDVNHPTDVVALMLDVFSVSAAKVTTLRERGFEPDEWCEVEWGHKTVRIT